MIKKNITYLKDVQDSYKENKKQHGPQKVVTTAICYPD